MNRTELDRFFRYVKIPQDKNISCWEWTGPKNRGYGYFTFMNCRTDSHRFSYAHFYGEISPGMVIHHNCHNRDCVNPYHLEMITIGEHTRKHSLEIHKSKTHCIRGHELIPENLSFHGHCKLCKKAWSETKRLADPRLRDIVDLTPEKDDA